MRLPILLPALLLAGCTANPFAALSARLGATTIDANASLAAAGAPPGRMLSRPYRMEADGQGTVWVLALNTNILLRIKGAGASLDTFAVGGNHVDLAVARGGDVWLSEQDGSLTKVGPDGNRLGSWPLAAEGQAALALDAEDRPWIARFDAKTLTRIGPDGAAQQAITLPGSPYAVAVDGQGTVWAATPPNTLYGYTAAGEKRVETTVGQQITALVGAAAGGVWLTNDDGTVRRLDAAGQELVKRDVGRPSYGLAEDADGALWLGGGGTNEQTLRLGADGTPGLSFPGRSEDVLLAAGKVWSLNRLTGKITVYSP